MAEIKPFPAPKTPHTSVDLLREIIFFKTLPARAMVWFSFPVSIVSTLISLMGTEMLPIPQAVVDACPGFVISLIWMTGSMLLMFVAVRWEHEPSFREEVRGRFCGWW